MQSMHHTLVQQGYSFPNPNDQRYPYGRNPNAGKAPTQPAAVRSVGLDGNFGKIPYSRCEGSLNAWESHLHPEHDLKICQECGAPYGEGCHADTEHPELYCQACAPKRPGCRRREPYHPS